jgi:two-component system NarL family response regulator
MNPAPAVVAAPASPREQTAIRVLIADDHEVVREGLVAMIGRQADMHVVAQAADGIEAVRLWREQRPDVALVDLRMPGLDGVGVVGQVRAVDAMARILILTTYDGDEDIYRGMRAGAMAYLLKDAPREQLLDCIRAVHAGNTYVPPDVAAKLTAQAAGERLTDREQEILVLLAAGDSNKLIARKLMITEGTVKTHVKSVLFKLGAASRTEAAAVAARRGLVQR